MIKFVEGEKLTSDPGVKMAYSTKCIYIYTNVHYNIVALFYLRFYLII